jgi:hypothetical protein
MDKKIIYGIGGVAVIGIIAYLYNKKKKDDALKITTMADAPVVNSEPIITTEDMTPTLLEDSMVVMPDGSIVDGSLIAVETNPSSMTMTDPTRVPTNQMATSPITFTDPKNMTTATSAPARFDGGFDYADGYRCSLDPVLGM